MAGLAAYVFLGGFIWLACRSIYRLYFHPLSGFPGPKLAAITSGYECYFNVVKKGCFIWELQRLHEVYGLYCMTPAFQHSNFNTPQGPLSESHLEKSISKTQNTTMRYTPVLHVNVRKMP